MRANELRIENYVFALGEIRQVLGISNRLRPDCGYYEFEDISIPIKGIHLEPIPLTEEWLLKFGFEYSDHYGNYKIKPKNSFYNSVKHHNNQWFYNNDESDAACYGVTTVNYVHELQNLYFAIYGEELTIK